MLFKSVLENWLCEGEHVRPNTESLGGEAVSGLSFRVACVCFDTFLPVKSINLNIDAVLLHPFAY